MVDLDREQDIEELRRIAHALEAQNRILLDVIARKSKEIDQLRGGKGDIQLTLKMLEALQAKAKAAAEALAKAEAARATRTSPSPSASQGHRLDRPSSRCCRSSRGNSSSMTQIGRARAAAEASPR